MGRAGFLGKTCAARKSGEFYGFPCFGVEGAGVGAAVFEHDEFVGWGDLEAGVVAEGLGDERGGGGVGVRVSCG